MYTTAAKYDHKTERQIGVAMVRDGKQIIIDWQFLGPWFQFDPEVEAKLRKADILRRPKESRPTRYRFDL
jgi:hypothetical protein